MQFETRSAPSLRELVYFFSLLQLKDVKCKFLSWRKKTLDTKHQSTIVVFVVVCETKYWMFFAKVLGSMHDSFIRVACLS